MWVCPHILSSRCHTDKRCKGAPLRQAESGCDHQSLRAAGYRPGLHWLQRRGGAETTGRRGSAHGLHRYNFSNPSSSRKLRSVQLWPPQIAVGSAIIDPKNILLVSHITFFTLHCGIITDFPQHLIASSSQAIKDFSFHACVSYFVPLFLCSNWECMTYGIILWNMVEWY